MSVPIIGITANTKPASEGRSAETVVSENYLQAVLRAGGAPVIIPSCITGESLFSLFDRLDGLLITGGSDIDPARFRGVPHPRVYGIDTPRDELEIQLIQRAAIHHKPFLGICRGIQAINVALGGTLYTDIEEQLSGALKHDYYPDSPRDYPAHTIQLTPESRLAQILGGEQFPVNSLHHQGIQRLAAELRLVAYAPDGLVEAVELTDHPFGMGVQWHPECLPDRSEQRALFRALIKAAAIQSGHPL